MENVVYLELIRRGEEVFYWKDASGREVDFLLTEGGKPARLIQVTQSLKDKKVKDRELKPLIKAAEKFNLEDCLILTEDQKDDISFGKINIKVRPIWSWLLSPHSGQA